MTRIDASQVEGLPAASGGGYPMAIAYHKSSAAIGQATDATYYQRDLPTLWTSGSWGASLSQNALLLPPGTYLLDYWIKYPPCRGVYTGLKGGSDEWLSESVAYDYSNIVNCNYRVGRWNELLVLDNSNALSVWVRHSSAYSGYGGSNKGIIYGSPSPSNQFFTQLVAVKIG